MQLDGTVKWYEFYNTQWSDKSLLYDSKLPKAVSLDTFKQKPAQKISAIEESKTEKPGVRIISTQDQTTSKLSTNG